MEDLSPVLAKRLKELRESRGLTLAGLSKALTEKYGIQISKESLTNYEVVDSFHSKARKNEGMSVKYLRCLADFYGVSTDYLLGLTDPDNSTADKKLRMISEYTGLSNKAISRLHELSEYIKAHPAGFVQNPYNILLTFDGPEFTSQPDGNIVSASKVFSVSLIEYLHERATEVSPDEIAALDDETNTELFLLSEQLATIGYTVAAKQKVINCILEEACDALKGLFREYGDNMKKEVSGNGKH